MMNNDHKYSVPVNFLHDDSASIQEASMAAKWYRHLVAPGIPTGLWIRQMLEQTEDYLIQILNQNKMVRGESSDCCLVLCGGGYDILLLRNDTPFPEYIDDVPRIGVSLLLTSIVFPTNSMENLLNEYGIVDPVDDLYMHMNVAVNMGIFPGNFRIYLRANENGPAYQDGYLAKKVILRIENHAHNPAKVLKVDHKDAPEHIFCYQYDIWGIRESRINRRDNVKVNVRLTNEPTIAPAMKTTQPSSRKRARKESSESVHDNRNGKIEKRKTVIEPMTEIRQQKSIDEGTRHEEAKGVVKTPVLNPNLSAKQGSLVTVKKNPKAVSKSTPASASTNSGNERQKPNGKANDAKPAAVPKKISKKVSDSDTMTNAAASGSSSSKGRKTISTQKPNQKQVSNGQKEVTGDSATRPVSTATLPASKVLNSVAKKKECFYYPFCQMSVDECGGTQRGRCREVKSGRVNVSPNIDRKVLSEMKRKAKRTQQ